MQSKQLFKRADITTVSVQRDVLGDGQPINTQITDFSTRYGFGGSPRSSTRLAAAISICRDDVGPDPQIATGRDRPTQLSDYRSRRRNSGVLDQVRLKTAMEGSMRNLIALQAQRREAGNICQGRVFPWPISMRGSPAVRPTATRFPPSRCQLNVAA